MEHECRRDRLETPTESTWSESHIRSVAARLVHPPHHDRRVQIPPAARARRRPRLGTQGVPSTDGLVVRPLVNNDHLSEFPLAPTTVPARSVYVSADAVMGFELGDAMVDAHWLLLQTLGVDPHAPTCRISSLPQRAAPIAPGSPHDRPSRGSRRTGRRTPVALLPRRRGNDGRRRRFRAGRVRVSGCGGGSPWDSRCSSKTESGLPTPPPPLDSLILSRSPAPLASPATFRAQSDTVIDAGGCWSWRRRGNRARPPTARDGHTPDWARSALAAFSRLCRS